MRAARGSRSISLCLMFCRSFEWAFKMGNKQACSPDEFVAIFRAMNVRFTVPRGLVEGFQKLLCGRTPVEWDLGCYYEYTKYIPLFTLYLQPTFANRIVCAGAVGCGLSRSARSSEQSTNTQRDSLTCTFLPSLFPPVMRVCNHCPEYRTLHCQHLVIV